MSTRHQITYTLHPFGETTQFPTNVAWFTTTTSFFPVLYASSFGMKRSNKYKNTAKGEGKDFIQNFRENETKMLTLSWKFVNSAYSVSVTCHNLCLSSGMQLHVIWVVERPSYSNVKLSHWRTLQKFVLTCKNIASPLPLRGYYFDERPSCKTTAKFFYIYVAARNLSFGHFCWAVLEKQLF